MSIRDLGIIEITVFLVLLAAFLFFFGLFVMLRHRQRYSGVRYARKQRLMEKALQHKIQRAPEEYEDVYYPSKFGAWRDGEEQPSTGGLRNMQGKERAGEGERLDSRDEGRAGQGWKRTGQEQNRSSQRTQYGAAGTNRTSRQEEQTGTAGSGLRERQNAAAGGSLRERKSTAAGNSLEERQSAAAGSSLAEKQGAAGGSLRERQNTGAGSGLAEKQGAAGSSLRERQNMAAGSSLAEKRGASAGGSLRERQNTAAGSSLAEKQGATGSSLREGQGTAESRLMRQRLKESESVQTPEPGGTGTAGSGRFGQKPGPSETGMSGTWEESDVQSRLRERRNTAGSSLSERQLREKQSTAADRSRETKPMSTGTVQEWPENRRESGAAPAAKADRRAAEPIRIWDVNSQSVRTVKRAQDAVFVEERRISHRRDQLKRLEEAGQ